MVLYPGELGEYAGEATKAATDAYGVMRYRHFRTPVGDPIGAFIVPLFAGDLLSYLPDTIDSTTPSSGAAGTTIERISYEMLARGLDVFLVRGAIARGSARDMPLCGGANIRWTGPVVGLQDIGLCSVTSSALIGGKYDITTVFAGSVPVPPSDPGSDETQVLQVYLGNVLTFNSNPSNNDTVTIGSKTYTFKTALTPAANEILIGVAAANSRNNLVAAINGAAGAGTTYGTGTVAHTVVNATVALGNALQVVSILPVGPIPVFTGCTETLTDAASIWTSASLNFPTAGTYKITNAAAQSTATLNFDSTMDDIAAAMMALAAFAGGEILVADRLGKTGNVINNNTVDDGHWPHRSNHGPLYGPSYPGNGGIIGDPNGDFAIPVGYVGTVHPLQDPARINSFKCFAQFMQYWKRRYGAQYKVVGGHGSSWGATTMLSVSHADDRSLHYNPNAVAGQQDAVSTADLFDFLYLDTPQTAMEYFADGTYLSGVMATAGNGGGFYLDKQATQVIQGEAGALPGPSSLGSLSVVRFGQANAARLAKNKKIKVYLYYTDWADTQTGPYSLAKATNDITNPHDGVFGNYFVFLFGPENCRFVTPNDPALTAPTNAAQMDAVNIKPIIVADGDPLIAHRLAWFDSIIGDLSAGNEDPPSAITTSVTSPGSSTLAEMVQEIGLLTGDVSNARKPAIRGAVQRCYDALSAQYEWPQLILVDETGLRKRDDVLKTLIANEPEFVLPVDATQIKTLLFQDGRSGPMELVEAQRAFEAFSFTVANPARPTMAAIIGTSPQHRRLAASGPLTMLCPDTAINDYVLTASIDYKLAAGMAGQYAKKSLSGPFSVGIQITPDAAVGYPISKVHIPDTWKGGFQILDEDGVILVDIRNRVEPQATTESPTSRTYGYTLLRAMPTPDADYGLTIVCKRRPPPLDADDDVPEMPVSSYIIEHVAADILTEKGELAKAQVREGLAQQYLRKLIHQERRPAQVVPPRGGNFLMQTGV